MSGATNPELGMAISPRFRDVGGRHRSDGLRRYETPRLGSARLRGTRDSRRSARPTQGALMTVRQVVGEHRLTVYIAVVGTITLALQIVNWVRR